MIAHNGSSLVQTEKTNWNLKKVRITKHLIDLSMGWQRGWQTNFIHWIWKTVFSEFFFINCSAIVYEEEDYQPGTYGYVLCPEVTEAKACAMLKEAEEELIKKSKASDDFSDVSLIKFNNKIIYFF